MPVTREWTYEDEVVNDLCLEYAVAAQARPLALALRLARGEPGSRAYYDLMAEDDKAAEAMYDEALLSAFSRSARARPR